MSISSNALSWLKGMCKDSIGPIKWRIVTMICNEATWGESLPSLRLARESKTEHDSCEPTSSVKCNVDVCFSLWDPGEGQAWCHTPDLKGFLNGGFHLSHWQLWGIVYDPSKQEGASSTCCCLEQPSIRRLSCSILHMNEVDVQCVPTGGGIRGRASPRTEDRQGSGQVTPCLLSLSVHIHKIRITK
jgi:hypothetical protein